jgi:hypothetical protein
MSESQNYKYFYCNIKFSDKILLILDRISNFKCCSHNNVRLACCDCNHIRSNHNPTIGKVKIQLLNYALQINLTMTLTNKDTIRQLKVPNIVVYLMSYIQ